MSKGKMAALAAKTNTSDTKENLEKFFNLPSAKKSVSIDLNLDGIKNDKINPDEIITGFTHSSKSSINKEIVDEFDRKVNETHNEIERVTSSINGEQENELIDHQELYNGGSPALMVISFAYLNN
jgi:hypothetical protein